MSTINIPNTPAFAFLRDWLKELGGHGGHGAFGLMRTSDGADFVVMKPEQLAEIEAILSDPAFAAALEAGVSDAAHGRVSRVPRGLPLRDAASGVFPCDASAANAIEQGCADALAGRTSRLSAGRSLKDLL